MELQVLMVDDHAPIIEGYKSILSFNPHGYVLNTTEAYSCEIAYEVIVNAKQSFEVIFQSIQVWIKRTQEIDQNIKIKKELGIPADVSWGI